MTKSLQAETSAPIIVLDLTGGVIRRLQMVYLIFVVMESLILSETWCLIAQHYTR